MRRLRDPFAAVVRSKLVKLYERYFEKWEPTRLRSRKSKMERRRIRRRFEKEKIVSACQHDSDVGDVHPKGRKR